MRLRTAIKICKIGYGVDGKALRQRVKMKGYRHHHFHQARKRCWKRAFDDRRIPYLPSEEELEEQYQITMTIFNQLAKHLLDPNAEKEGGDEEGTIRANPEIASYNPK